MSNSLRKDIQAFGIAMWKHWGWWVGATVGSTIATIFQAGGGMIPSWTLWLIALGGIVVAAFKAHQDQCRITERVIKTRDGQIEKLLENQKLKFKLSCPKEEIIGCAIESLDYQWKYFRMLVEADCSREIENCCGHLNRIEKDGEVIYGHDAIILPFAKSEDNDSTAKTISPGQIYRLDVLIIKTGVHAVFFATKGQPTDAFNHKREYVFSGSGEYILHISITGKEAKTATAKLKFTWKGLESTATIEKINE